MAGFDGPGTVLPTHVATQYPAKNEHRKNNPTSAHLSCPASSRTAEFPALKSGVDCMAKIKGTRMMVTFENETQNAARSPSRIAPPGCRVEKFADMERWQTLWLGSCRDPGETKGKLSWDTPFTGISDISVRTEILSQKKASRRPFIDKSLRTVPRAFTIPRIVETGNCRMSA